nr:cleavage and polyadenylation specificity factor subunit 2 [Cryptococcus depauperatus CBS 7855]
MITLTPLSASANQISSSEPVCYLLQLDEARILLDLGQKDYRASTYQTSWHYEQKVKELAPTLDLVLLSHSPLNYLSLYPFARARWGLKCPVYATQPTVEMGRVVCLTESESWRSENPVEVAETNDDQDDLDGVKKPFKGPFVPTTEEIHEAFDWIKAVRYNQPLHLSGEFTGCNLSHLLLTPFPSGHTLGGSLFKIRSPTSGTVLYAVGINHTSERHLDGMVGVQNGPTGYAEGVLRPDLLVVEAGRCLVINSKRKERELAIIDLVTTTLEQSHSILLPVDPAPRLLELLLLLDQHWTHKRDVWPHPLCIVSKTAQDMVVFARSLVEWMGGMVKNSGVDVVDVGKGKRSRGAKIMSSEFGALDFKHVQFFATPTELLQTYPLNRPKLVLAIPPTMSHGPSRFLFTSLAAVEGNVILLTSRSEEQTLARDLYDRWERQQDMGSKWGQGKTGKAIQLEDKMLVQVDSKVPLTGAEREAHLESERLQKEKDAAHKAAVDRSRRMLEADDLESDSDSESESGDPTSGITIRRTEGANAYAGDGEDVRTMSFDIYVKGQQMKLGRGAEMARYRMFPFAERKGRKIDQYGEGLDIGQWMRKGREIAEEGETEEVREAKKRKEEEEEKAKQEPEVPSKYVSEQVPVDLKAKLFFVDMEGLIDGQSIRTIVSDLQPRKLASIFVRSSQNSTSKFESFLHSVTGFTKDIFAPTDHEEIKIGEHVQSYSLSLGDSLTTSLAKKWSEFEGYDVTMVNGKVILPADSTIPVLESSAFVTQPLKVKLDEDNTDTAKVIDLESSTKEQLNNSQFSAWSPMALPSSTFIGDLRLMRLKQRLSLLNPPIPAEFAGEGVLVCGPDISKQNAKGSDVVAVRKTGHGRVVMEGNIGKLYHDVRATLYTSLARVDAA